MTAKATRQIVGVIALMISGNIYAQTQVPNNFQTGQPALAVEVNENFSTLESAANQNAADILANNSAMQADVVALQAQVAALELSVAGLSPGILNISYVTGSNVSVDLDSGPVTGRVLIFDKLEAASVLRITYSDNLRVLSKNPAAFAGSWGTRWIIYLDGTPTQVHTRLNTNGYVAVSGFVQDVNHHRQSTLIGYLEGVSTGQHTITVEMVVEGNNNDAYTGWESSFLIEVMELP